MALCPGVTGDLVVFKRTGYDHYAVNVGNGYIVHLTSREDFNSFDIVDGVSGHICSANPDIAVIKKEKYRNVFKSGDKTYVEENKKKPLQTWEIVERALSRVGEKGYNLLQKNCEHIARWCCYGEEESTQVDTLKFGAGVVLGAAAVLGIGHLVANVLKDDSEEDKRKEKRYRY